MFQKDPQKMHFGIIKKKWLENEDRYKILIENVRVCYTIYLDVCLAKNFTLYVFKLKKYYNKDL